MTDPVIVREGSSAMKNPLNPRQTLVLNANFWSPEQGSYRQELAHMLLEIRAADAPFIHFDPIDTFSFRYLLVLAVTIFFKVDVARSGSAFFSSLTARRTIDAASRENCK